MKKEVRDAFGVLNSNPNHKNRDELERRILTNREYAHLYAQNVIRGRWEPCEEIISQSRLYNFSYACHIVKGRFPLWGVGNINRVSLRPATDPGLKAPPMASLSCLKTYKTRH